MNTATHPRTIYDTPGPCCSLMKLDPNPVMPAATFLDRLDAAKTKAQVIDVLCERASQQGWFSGIAEHPGLYDKLARLRANSRPVEPAICESCET